MDFLLSLPGLFASNPILPVALVVFLLCVALIATLLRTSSSKTGPDAVLLLTSLLETMPQPAYWKRSDGRFLGSNNRFDQLFPLRDNAAKTEGLGQRMQPRDARRLDRDDMTMLTGSVRPATVPDTRELETALGMLPMEVVRVPLFRGRDRAVGLLVLLSPIDGTAMQGGAEISWLFDLDTGRFLHISPQFERIWGRPRSALLNGLSRLEESVHPSDLPETGEARLTMPLGLGDEYRILHADGSLRYLRSTRTRLLDEQGKELPLLAGVEEDITEERHMAELLTRAGAPGLAATLGSAVAHEITQPLNAMSLRISSLQYMLDKGRTPDQETLRKYLDDIESGARRLTDTVEHMRALIRRDAPAETGPVDLNRCCEQGLDLLSARAEAHGLALDFHPWGDDSEKQLMIRGNAQLCEQVVINLVSNAIQALQLHSRYDGRILVSTFPSSGLAVLLVEDNGPGFPQEDRDRLLEPFTSGPDSSGSGLGLALCRHFIRNWDGTIHLDTSQTLGGAAVRVELPLLSDAATG